MGTERKPWPYISRSVEPVIEDCLSRPCGVVYVRGQRRSGKSTVVRKVVDKSKRAYRMFLVSSNYEDNVNIAANLSDSFTPTTTVDIREAVVRAVQEGKVVIIEEIQNAPHALQVSLQAAVDHLKFARLTTPTKFQNAGMLFLMGSLPTVVEDIMEDRKSPLFQRVTAHISVLPFNTTELLEMFDFLNINDPRSILSLYSLFGAHPHPFQIAYEAGLLDDPGNIDIVAIAGRFLASELKMEAGEAAQFYISQLGEELARALQVIHSNPGFTKDKQLAAVKSALGSDVSSQHVFHLVSNVLYQRLGIIEPVFSPNNMKQIHRFNVSDPLFLTVQCLDGAELRVQDQMRCCHPEFAKRQKDIEGVLFERLVRAVAQDRYLLLNEPPFPLPIFKPGVPTTPRVAPQLVFAIKDTEIDLFCGIPTQNILIVGSCKRSESKGSKENLRSHWSRFQKSTSLNQLLRFLKLDERALSVVFVHLVPHSKYESVQKLEEDTYLVSLHHMLKDFPKLVSPVLLLPEGAPASQTQITQKQSWAASGIFLLSAVAAVTLAWHRAAKI